MKTAGSFLLCLLMRTNEKCKILMPTAQASVVFCFLSEHNIAEGPEYEKNVNTISMYGEKFSLLHVAQRQAVQASHFIYFS